MPCPKMRTPSKILVTNPFGEISRKLLLLPTFDASFIFFTSLLTILRYVGHLDHHVVKKAQLDRVSKAKKALQKVISFFLITRMHRISYPGLKSNMSSPKTYIVPTVCLITSYKILVTLICHPVEKFMTQMISIIRGSRCFYLTTGT